MDMKLGSKFHNFLRIKTQLQSYTLQYLCVLHLSGHNVLIQRMHHNRNIRLYELRICDKCDCHTVQNEEHVLLDYPHEHLVSLRSQHHQLVIPPQYENSPNCLRTFLNQPDVVYGVASFVAECLTLFPSFFLAPL
jgi:hypothetical protein